MSLTPRIDKIDTNYIINGNFDYWQRQTSQAFSAGSVFASVDRFRPSTVLATGAGTLSRSGNVPDSNSLYSARFAVTTAQASMSTTDSLRLVHFIEGNMLKPIMGKDVTLAFHFRTNKAGTYSVAFQNVGATSTYTTQFTVTSAEALAQLWVQRVFNLSLPGSWVINHTRSLSVVVALADGTTSNQAPSLNTWNSGSHTWHTGQVNFMDTIGNFAEFSKFMLVEGTHSSPEFVLAGKDFAGELQLCQRYYQKSGTVPGNEWYPGVATNAGIDNRYISRLVLETDRALINEVLKVQMRSNPTVTFYPGRNDVANTVDRITPYNTNTLVTFTNATAGSTSAIIGTFQTLSVNNSAYSLQYTADAEL